MPAGQMLYNVQVSENGHNTYTVAVQIRVTRSEWRSKVEESDGRGGVRAVTRKKISKEGERQREREREIRDEERKEKIRRDKLAAKLYSRKFKFLS